MRTLTKPPIIPEGYKANPSDSDFNNLFNNYRKELLPKGIKKKKTKTQKVSGWFLNTLKIAQ